MGKGFPFVAAMVVLGACAEAPPPPAPAQALVPASASAPAPTPSPVATSSAEAPDAVPPGARVCTNETQAYPIWTTNERAHREAATPITSAVRVGNQRAIGHDRAVMWAHYLVAVHNQLHPIFTDMYLASLCARDVHDPLNDPSLMTTIEVTVAANGSFERVGVIRSSGQESFDAAAIDSFERITSLPPLDASLLSADGRAHFTWVLHRYEGLGCTTMNARPYSLE